MCLILLKVVWAMNNLCRRSMIIDVSAAAQRPSGSSGRGKKIMAAFRWMSRLQQLAGRDEFVLEVSSLFSLQYVCPQDNPHHGFFTSAVHVFLPGAVLKNEFIQQRRSSFSNCCYPSLLEHKRHEGLCQSTPQELYSCVLG